MKALIFIALLSCAAPEASVPTNWVFLLAGQSNADGRGDVATLRDPSYAEVFPAVRHAYQVACYSEDAPDQKCNAEVAWRDLQPKSAVFGPAESIGRALSAVITDADNSVHIIESATGGTDLYDDWDPTATTTGRLHYLKMLRFWGEQKATLPAGDFKFGGTFWIQGERDAQDILGGPNYEANLLEFVAAIEADLGTGAPFVAATLSKNAVAWTYKADVNAGFNAVASAGVRMLPVYTDTVELKSDATHYTSDGLVDLGTRMANRALEYWGFVLTTTPKLIREQQASLITALTPASHSGVKFEEYSRTEEFRDWAEANPAAALRKFYIEDVGAYESPLSSDMASEEIVTTFSVTVAYPKNNRYGLDNKRDAFDVIDQDRHAIDEAIGHRGYVDHVAGQNSALAVSKDIEEGEAVWFLSMEYDINFRRAF